LIIDWLPNAQQGETMTPGMTRRAFATAAAVTTFTAASYSRVHGANNNIRLGFIGCGNRGDQLIDSFANSNGAIPVAFCDLNDDYLKQAETKVDGLRTRSKDYRQLLDNKDLDAVVIATPDHWHALQTVEALQAGKHVYVEKPLSLCVAEGRVMVEAAKKANKIVQVGLQRRSMNFCRDAVEYIRKDGIGDITSIRCFHIQNEWPLGIGNQSDSTPPESLDWDKWVGPAPMKPYNVNRAYYKYRWFYDYSGGQLANFGVHYLDMVHWVLGVDGPKSVAAMGGKFAIKDNREIPDTLEVLWQYPNNVLVTFTQVNANGAPGCSQPGAEVEFRGTKGTLYLQGKDFVVIPDSNMDEAFPVLTPLDRNAMKKWRQSARSNAQQTTPRRVEGNNDTVWHTRNFISSIINNKVPACPVETGHRSTSAALIANIALKTHALLEWDTQTEKFTNNQQANALLRYDYRQPYKFPEVKG
jgi:predicted dehydrogenase